MAAILATSAVGSLSSLNKDSLTHFTASNGSCMYAAANRVFTFSVMNDGGTEKPLWLPGVKEPEYIDGTFISDFGFDPLGLSKPAEYLQFDVNDHSQSVLSFSELVGKAEFEKEGLSATPFQLCSEAFSLTRFRENEVIHGQWAIIFIFGTLSMDVFTGVTWHDSGKVKLEQGSRYLSLSLPFSISTLVIIELLLTGYVEIVRNSELDPKKRLCLGCHFDPLGLVNKPEK